MNEDEKREHAFLTRHCDHALGEYSLTIIFSHVRHMALRAQGHQNEVSIFGLSPKDIEALALALLKESTRVYVHYEQAKAEAKANEAVKPDQGIAEAV